MSLPPDDDQDLERAPRGQVRRRVLTTGHGELAAALERLREGFSARLEGRLEDLRADLAALEAGDGAALARLEAGAHTLAGGAGTFGLPAVGQAARALELCAQRLAASPNGAGVADLRTRLAELERASAPGAEARPEPAAGARPEAAAEPAAPPAPDDDDDDALIASAGDLPGLRGVVVVIEDDPDQLAMLVTLARRGGFEAHGAPDGATGLALVQEVMPDLVLCDVMLPDIQGFEVLRRLREDPALALVPVVMVTALAERRHHVRALELGCDDFVLKPVDPVILLARVRSLMRIKRLGRLLQDALGRYLPAQVLQRLMAAPDALQLGGRREIVTTLFADIAGFTALAERQSVETVVGLLNESLTQMAWAVEAHQGVVDKYIGDEIMARFEAGDAPGQAPAAVRAVRAALAIEARMEAWSRSAAERGLPPLRVRVSLGTGPCIVGNVGASHRMEFTAIGDSVNTAARLQAVAKQEGHAVVVDQATRLAIGDAFDVVPLGPRLLPGKVEPVQVYAVTG